MRRIIAGVSMWEVVAERGTQVAFSAGQVLMRQGDIGTHCYALVEGEVLVEVTALSGSTAIIGRRGPGSVIGEMAALLAAERSATVTAHTDVVARVLRADELEAALAAEPELAVGELKRLARQLRDLTVRYSARGEDLTHRVLQILEMNAAETGSRVFRSTREELAGWVGATREAVTRTLRDLEKQGVVRLRRGSVELLDGV
ncbi:MAG: Crp/Fnr family transcriptional regulator [Acidimicrobiales bacterium]